MESDTTPPEAPQGLSYDKNESGFVFQWDEAQDNTPGSWVAYYNVYKDGELIGKSYGRKYIHFPEPKKREEFKIKVVNVNGLESEEAVIIIE